MDLLSELSKGNGCGPQQGSVGGLAGQMRAGLLQQQQHQQQQQQLGTAQWGHNMQQAMYHGAPASGLRATEARFGQSMPAPALQMPQQQRAHTMPVGNWTVEFAKQQQQQQHAAILQRQLSMPDQHMVMSLPEAWQARAEMTRQQQRQQLMHMQQQQQQQQQMMMMRQMMMMQQQPQMNPMMMQMRQQMHTAPVPVEQYAAADARQVNPIQKPGEVATEESGGAKEAEVKEEGASKQSNPMHSDAYRRMEEAWAKALKNETPLDSVWKEMMAMNGLDSEADVGASYRFQRENRFMESASTVKELFIEGMRLFKEGRINNAILAFEAVVQQEKEHSEAWRMLGRCHADNDEDQKAIVCLEKSAECDPYNLQTLLTLGACYVNELDPERALKNLKAWVEGNPEFVGLEVQKDPYSDGSLLDEVMNLMLQVQAHDPTNADVQEVLGVLYNVSKDYDHAIAAFRKALDKRQDDYALWNKLGATQANSGHSEEAMPAYHRALELKPRYARGLLNLGISHSNIGSFEEALRHYLSALALNPKGNHIWSFIRNAARALGRMDLVHKANMRDIAAFQVEFDIPFLEQKIPAVDPVV